MITLVYHHKDCKIYSEGECSCTASVEIYKNERQSNLEKAKFVSTYFSFLAGLTEKWVSTKELEPLLDGLEDLLGRMQDDIESMLRQDAEFVARFESESKAQEASDG